MTPKEKAEVIFEKMLYAHGSESWYERAKECAFIAVDEIIEKHYDDWDEHSDYWQEVKQEIEKL
jgi:hypothetical protein